MLIDYLNRLPRRTIKLVYLALDVLLVPLSLSIAVALRYGTSSPEEFVQGEPALFAGMIVAGVVVCLAFRLPSIRLSSLETRAAQRIGAAAGTLSVTAMALSYMLGLTGPRSVPLIFGAVFFMTALSLRFAMLSVLNMLDAKSNARKPVLIYGAGAAGLQLAGMLKASHDMRCVGFIDDNPHLQNLIMAGHPVHSHSRAVDMIRKRGIKTVLLAMPSVAKTRLQEISERLSALGVEVQLMPSYTEMLSGREAQPALKTVHPDAILGRDRVDLNTPEIARAYAGRTVMVTGAGGSIGSELCRQLLECHPARVVLFEQSEFALYQIDQEMRARGVAKAIPITARLGSVTDRGRVEAVMREEAVEIVLHAAAYKHVPLVEENELEGARNNVIGTQVVAEVAMSLGVERFILVSTDKAVRPTNIMGATKRMAELVIQDLAARAKHTRFAMVRFGNVLGSSGSVLPLFQKQIAAGGPVTVTHPEVTRFFMTIPEASRLVLLAGAYAEGGDVFVLDMGEPRKIIDIAKQMITLSGRTVRNAANGEGDIEIRITGLRPGEKLYEELLIDDSSLRPTPHPKILRAKEEQLSQIEVAAMVREISASVQAAKPERLREIVRARVRGYKASGNAEAVTVQTTSMPA